LLVLVERERDELRLEKLAVTVLLDKSLELVAVEVAQDELKAHFGEEVTELLREAHHVLKHDQHRVFQLLESPC